MPFCYSTLSVMQSATYSTSATPSTEIDVFSMKPGTARMTNLMLLRGQGRGAALTTLSGISLLLKDWTTASTAGTTLTPTPDDKTSAPAAATVVRIGTGGGVNAVTPGTGGPLYRGGIGFSGTGPGLWQAYNPDAAKSMNAAYAGSLDVYSISGTASMLYEFEVGHSE